MLVTAAAALSLSAAQPPVAVVRSEGTARHEVGLGAARVAPGTRGGFAFVAHQPGRADEPVAYPRCRPVHLVVNSALAPPGASGILREALGAVATATGLRLVLDGRTDAQPDAAGTGIGVGRAPALVAWTTPRRVPGLAGRVLGLGGSSPRTDPASGYRYYLTGTIALDAPALGGLLRRPGGRARVLAVVLHELGHLVGLTHVRDARELMNGESSRLGFGPGDRRGLALLGAGRCVG